MNYEKIIELLTAIGTVGAVIVAMIAIRRSDKNSKKQIVVEKLEELFESVKLLARYYGTFKTLDSYVLSLRDENNSQIQTRAQYNIKRDELLSIEDNKRIEIYLSRIEVIAKCYIKNDLQAKILEYEDLMSTFYDFILNTGSIYKEIKYKNGFPKFEIFFSLLEDLKAEIVKVIKFK